MEFLFLDLESRPDLLAVEAAIAAKHDELEAVTAPANYRDGQKIAQYRQDKQAAIIADLRKEAALSPFTAYVSSLALRLGEQARTQVHILVPRSAAEPVEAPAVTTDFDLHPYLYGGDSERRAVETALLTEFWTMFDNASGYTCGFNSQAFDLPFLIKRSMRLGLCPPACPVSLRRYSTTPTRDLYAILNGWTPGKGGLKTVCQALGIDNLLPDLRGSDVASLPWPVEAQYVANDVRLTVALAERMAGWWWPIAQPEGDAESLG